MSDYPVLAEAMINRAESYNRAIDFINNPPSDCDIRVITPPKNFTVGRITTDPAKLDAGYQPGLEALIIEHKVKE